MLSHVSITGYVGALAKTLVISVEGNSRGTCPPFIPLDVKLMLLYVGKTID